MTPREQLASVLEANGIPGALVLSLDLDLYWGVFDRHPLDRKERERLIAARAVVAMLLEIFEEYGVRATWAPLGLLFAGSARDVERFRPGREVDDRESRLNPFLQSLGECEIDDPYHFAPSLIARIAETPGQEVACRSFAPCKGKEDRRSVEDFEADLLSAVEIATVNGYQLSSYVFAGDRFDRAFLPSLARFGFNAYRETPRASMTSATALPTPKLHNRAGEFLDSYVGLYEDQTHPWPGTGRLVSVPVSRILRPYLPQLRTVEPLLIERITAQMESACEQGRIFHLCMRPEEFASYPHANLRSLRRILNVFRELKSSRGMLSLNLSEIAAGVSPQLPTEPGSMDNRSPQTEGASDHGYYLCNGHLSDLGQPLHYKAAGRDRGRR